MSPRRGGSGGYYGGYYTDNPWNNEVSFSLESLSEPKSYFIAGFSFDVLTVVALIGFLVWACLIRNHRGSMRGVIVSIVTWLLSAILIVIYEIFFLADVSLTEYFRIDMMLYDFFGILSSCLVFYVFYNLIHGLLDRLTDAGRPYAWVSTVHWILLGLVSALSIVAWALFVAFEVLQVSDGYNVSYKVTNAYIKVDSARSIVYWVLSLEILAWAIFVIAKAGSHRFNSKTPAITLLIGSIFWFALNLMWAIVAIRYNLENTYLYPLYLQLAESILGFLFTVGVYVGILLCCSNWSKLDKFVDQPPVNVQYPYGAMPGVQPAYQGYQPYPQQPYSQPQQPYPQQPYPQQPYQPPQ